MSERVIRPSHQIDQTFALHSQQCAKQLTLRTRSKRLHVAWMIEGQVGSEDSLAQSFQKIGMLTWRRNQTFEMRLFLSNFAWKMPQIDCKSSFVSSSFTFCNQSDERVFKISYALRHIDTVSTKDPASSSGYRCPDPATAG